MTHTELDLRERRAIEDMLHVKMTVNEIAPAIGGHRSTVYREIRRNRFEDDELLNLSGYYGSIAQRTADARRARRRKLIRLVHLRAHVVNRLVDGWTPEQIAGRLGYDGEPVGVSHETIYAYVYSAEGQSEDLARYLLSRRKRPRQRYARRPRGQVFPADRSIHERPEHVTTRETFGDWEIRGTSISLIRLSTAAWIRPPGLVVVSGCVETDGPIGLPDRHAPIDAHPGDDLAQTARLQSFRRMTS